MDEEKKEKTTCMNLSLPNADKVKLKIYAIKQGKTISAVVHEWINELIPDEQ